MSLREQMSLHRPALATGSEPTGPAIRRCATHTRSCAAKPPYVLERVELERLSRMPQESVRMEIGLLITRILDERLPANDIERRQLAMYDEMFGLARWLRDPTVSDILVNTYRQVLCRALRPASNRPTT